MEQIILGDIARALAFVLTLAGSVGTIVVAVRKAIKKLFDEQTKDINARLDRQEDAIKNVDLETCKTFLVSYLVKIENDGSTDEIETALFWEQYQRYSELGGNSYIWNKVEKLKKSGKL